MLVFLLFIDKQKLEKMEGRKVVENFVNEKKFKFKYLPH